MTAAGLAVERKHGVAVSLPYYEQACSYGPSRFFPALMSARAYQYLGRSEDAATAYLRACHLDRGKTELRNQWLAALSGLPKGRSIIPIMTKGDEECVEALIKHSRKNKESEAVLEISRLALLGKPGNARFLYWHARSQLERGSREEASRETALLLGLHPDLAEGFLMAGLIRRNDQPYEAMYLFRAAVERAPYWDEPAIYLAQSAIIEKNEEAFLRAIHGLALSHKYQKKSLQMHALEGQFAHATGDHENAIRAFRKAGSHVRRTPVILIQLLDSLTRVGKLNSARALCARSEWPEGLRLQAKSLCDSIRSGQLIPSL
jgi:tetratricopeptide (TPR) repeat protein